MISSKLSTEIRSMHRPTKITAEMLSLSLPRRLHAMPTPSNPIIIHQSELANWQRCRVKWFLRHQLRLVRPGGAKNLEMGSMFHGAKETWYSLPQALRTVKRMKKIAKKLAWATEYLADNKKMVPYVALGNEERELIEAMAIGWARWALDPSNEHSDPEIGLSELVYPEMEFEHPLGDGSVRVRGRFDMPFKPSIYRNAMSCSETKTRSSFRDENLEQTIQLTTYLWAMRKQWPGKKRYSIWFERSRKQMPTDRVRTPLHDRQEIERSDEEIEQWEIDTTNSVIDMLGAAIYPSPQDSCSFMCDYQGPCILRGNKSDLAHVLNNEYVYKPEDER